METEECSFPAGFGRNAVAPPVGQSEGSSMNATKRILVTGAGGFIGHHLVKRLRADGHWVRAQAFHQMMPDESSGTCYQDSFRRIHGTTLTLSNGRSYSVPSESGREGALFRFHATGGHTGRSPSLPPSTQNCRPRRPQRP